VLDKVESSLLDKLQAIDAGIGKAVEEAMLKVLDPKLGRVESSMVQMVDEKMKQIEAQSAQMESLCLQLDQKVQSLATAGTPGTVAIHECIQGVLRTQSNEEKAEEQEIEKRKTSVIVHGVPESVAATSEQRVDDDLSHLASLLQDTPMAGTQFEKVIRLGKKSSDTGAKPRPLKLILDLVDSKVNLLKCSKNLRLKKVAEWPTILIHQDLTPKQREARNRLVQELKSRQSQGEQDLIIFNGQVVKRKYNQSTRTT
jgi:hypothetical protein